MSSKLFQISQLILDISNEELTNKFDQNQIIVKPVITSNDKDIGKVDDTEEFGFIMKIFYI